MVGLKHSIVWIRVSSIRGSCSEDVVTREVKASGYVKYPCGAYLQSSKMQILQTKLQEFMHFIIRKSMPCNTLIFQVASALLIVATTCGMVRMTNTTLVAFNPTSGSLSSTYSTTNLLGSTITWERTRAAGSYSKFAEQYVRSGQPSCSISCGPFAYPVNYNGGLFCRRDTGNYSYAAKQYCVPKVEGNSISFPCQLATFGIWSLGQCNMNTFPGQLFFPNPATDYECCFQAPNPLYAQIDYGAVIV